MIRIGTISLVILVTLLELVTVFNLFDYSLFETLILYRTTGSNS